MSKYVMQTRKTGALGADMAAGATSATLAASTFGTPTGKQIITIDGNVAAKAADFLCTIIGTAVTSMTLLNGPDVIHSSGAQVWMGMVDEHFDAFADPIDTGWVDASKDETWVYASASTFTIAGVDLTAKYTAGIKLRWKQGGGYKYGSVASSSFSTNTTVTILVNTDYTIANSAITDNYFSRIETPQAFPSVFNWTPSWFKNDASTTLSATVRVAIYTPVGRKIFGRIVADTIGDPSGANIFMSLPFTARDITGQGYNMGTGVVGSGGGNLGAMNSYSSDRTKASINVIASPSWSGASNSVNMRFDGELA